MSAKLKIILTVETHFCASHRLFNPALSQEENLEIYGICARDNGHGHNWVLQVSITGDVPEETGMILDMKKLKDLITLEIIDKVDHYHLNHDVEFLKGVNPTAENVGRVFWRILEEKIQGAELYEIKLYETPKNMVAIRRDD